MRTHPGTACPTRGRRHRAARESQRSRARGALCCTPGRPRLALAPLRNPLWARRLSQGKMDAGNVPAGTPPCFCCTLCRPCPCSPPAAASPAPHGVGPNSAQEPASGFSRSAQTGAARDRPSGLEDTAWKLQGADIPGVTLTNISMRKGVTGAVAALFWVVFGAAAPAEASTGCQGRSGSSDDVCRLTG